MPKASTLWPSHTTESEDLMRPAEPKHKDKVMDDIVAFIRAESRNIFATDDFQELCDPSGGCSETVRNSNY